MIKNPSGLKDLLVSKAKEFAQGCQKVFVAVSGGIDSATVVAILCETFGPENVVGLYRDVRNDKKHLADVKSLIDKFGFKLVFIDGNSIYDEILKQTKEQFEKLGLPWVDEGTSDADESGFTSAYASLKSRLTTPLAGFIAKAVDGGHGRIFGTGNGEEDGCLRYFDKFGDGAVDNNILAGLTKAEVRQLARELGVPENIITKKPSADLEAKGDAHNDEDQLTQWAKNLGFDIPISYGAPDGSAEGNIAWAWKEDLKQGVITGAKCDLDKDGLADLGYSPEQAQAVLFLRAVERSSRHKVAPIPCVERKFLMEKGLVD